MVNTYEEREVLLKVENLSHSIDGKMILENINFEIKNVVKSDQVQGQVIAFLGRSGRGKSTLFRLLTGLDNPTKGSISIHSEHASKYKNVEEGDVGFVDQKYTLFRHKTVYDALLYAGRNLKLSTEEKKLKIDKYIQDWGLAKVKDQYPNELSGGQRQRTAIIEQLISSQNYLILDEPFSGLDVGNVENVKSAIRLIDKSNDLSTIIFSTHDIELAVELADTIYVIGYINDGHTAHLLKCYDLKSLGMSWAPELTPSHYNLMREIKDILLKS
jgi:ABC-type sulfate/molybdate transport systems ATPase subunit